MMRTRTRPGIWNQDPELRKQAERERQNANRQRDRNRDQARPNGHDRTEDDNDRRIELVDFADSSPMLTVQSLLDDVLGEAQISCVIGPMSCGKTFFALNTGLHIALGRKFLGHEVTQGAVIYIAAEAGRSIHNRICAFRIKYGLTYVTDPPVPFFTLPRQIDLCTTDVDLNDVITAIRAKCGKNYPVLIIIDTLARVLGGGNENSSEDMGALITSADKLRDTFGCHVCIINHTGKDAGRGARGHSSLEAAVDTKIDVSRDDDLGVSTAKITKQRDGEIGKQIHFALEVVPIGTNKKGKRVTSCIVVPADAEVVAEITQKTNSIEMSKAQRRALDLLLEVIETDGQVRRPGEFGIVPPDIKRILYLEIWRKRCYDGGISKGEDRARSKAFQRAKYALKRKGYIDFTEHYVWLSNDGGNDKPTDTGTGGWPR